MHSGAELNSIDDDFEWVNAWAAGSVREHKPVSPPSSVIAAVPAPTRADDPVRVTSPRAASSPANAADANLSSAKVADANAAGASAAPRAEPTTARDPIVEAPPPPQSSTAAPIPMPEVQRADAVDVQSPSIAEIESLPMTDVDPPSPERRPWTSLFRLIAGGAGRPAGVPADFEIATETVTAEPPAREAGDLAPVLPQHDREHVPLSPDQLARDIAEIEIIRDQLLSEPGPVALAEAVVPRGRSSELAPILVGAALAFLLLVVFAAAASFVSLR